jgi:O-acetyl-ADP-ribose deacetylase (regulator of RNase III)
LSTFSYNSEVYFEVGKIVHRIKIHQGKINGLKVDAIVNPRPVGDGSESKTDQQHCLIGDMQVVPASSTLGSVVIEALGPIWQGGDHQEEEQLAVCYNKAMALAKRQNYRSIAFTPVSFGLLGFPLNRATKIAVTQVDLALRDNPLIESVIFCCSDPVTTALYRSQVGR